MTFIYVLKQTNQKYYIGKTENPKFRIDTHFKHGGCAWTRKYKPIDIVGLFPNCDNFDEDKFTLKYMKKYGIENVRGGSFCQIVLSSETKKCVERMISGANDTCHFCGKHGHYVQECKKKKKLEFEDDYVWECSYCYKPFETKKGAIFHENVHCKKRKNVSKERSPESDEIFEWIQELVDSDECYNNDSYSEEEEWESEWESES